MKQLKAEVLVVGDGTGGTAAALQAARRGAKTILVSEFPWLGGMLTSAGVSCPDGNELLAFQSGIWGTYLKELYRRHPTGLDHGWVSFFDYDPRVGAEIFADWVAALPNLLWIAGDTPQEVLRQGDRVVGVRFHQVTVTATITLDGTELGDLLALGEVPHRWGWEWQSEWSEPSAPSSPNEMTQRYPVQAPTWVVVMQDFGPEREATAIAPPPCYDPAPFAGAWERHGAAAFLSYGGLPNNRFMINWPIHGNDYGQGLQRLVGSVADRTAFWQAARWYSQGFAHYIQAHLGRRYGLALDTFPQVPGAVGGGAYALYPYYRESRRLQGVRTVREQDILPVANGWVAALPFQTAAQGCLAVTSECEAIALGNYANDHHYPGYELTLKPKSRRWGGRWTGTPFTIPYSSLVPAAVEGLLVCEKNIAVSHIANGATRLQPVVLGIGQAAGMAAALCVEQGCQPRQLAVRSLQEALLTEPTAPAAVLPFYNLTPNHPDWLTWQRYYLDHPEAYPATGDVPLANLVAQPPSALSLSYSGVFHDNGEQDYEFTPANRDHPETGQLRLVTLCPLVNQQLAQFRDRQLIQVRGRVNLAGRWLLVEVVEG